VTEIGVELQLSLITFPTTTVYCDLFRHSNSALTHTVWPFARTLSEHALLDGSRQTTDASGIAAPTIPSTIPKSGRKQPFKTCFAPIASSSARMAGPTQLAATVCSARPQETNTRARQSKIRNSLAERSITEDCRIVLFHLDGDSVMGFEMWPIVEKFAPKPGTGASFTEVIAYHRCRHCPFAFAAGSKGFSARIRSRLALPQ
jgi:hypothetical protein